MEEIGILPLEWSAPEYNHKTRTADWFWTIGLATLIATGIAVWLHNYVFAIFIFLSGACLIFFTIREPQTVVFTITNDGFTMGKEFHTWNQVKGFSIKKATPYNKLLLMTSKKFLPVYTIPFPNELSKEIKSSLMQVVENIELEESHSTLFMEKIGF